MPRRGLSLRPTLRGAVVLGAAVLLVLLGDLSGIRAARGLAGFLLVAIAVSLVCAPAAAIGLGLRRRVLDDAVTAPGTARVDLDLAPGALARVLPLALGTVRLSLPADLGGPGELELRPAMPHRVTVGRRGIHALGPCEIRARDVLGLVELRRRQALPGTITGLPRLEDVDPAVLRRAGLAEEDPDGSAARGGAEVGALARPYVAGDDMRRIHWRASARTGSLMTREEEPPDDRAAVVVIDTRRGPGADVRAEDRAVSVAASLWAVLRREGWAVRVVDATGVEVVRASAEAGGPASALGSAADAEAERGALLALAGLGFSDAAAAEGPARPAGGVTTGDVALVVAVLPADALVGSRDGADDPGERLAGLDALAGAATRRLALLIGHGPEGADATAGTAGTECTRIGRWDAVRLDPGASLADALAAAPSGAGR
ncbi:DUF58 domain-containing protein [Brachybacterium huguangmaarense]